jgi:phosphoglycolate phosphatase-like HAD superfamily hydrolase
MYPDAHLSGRARDLQPPKPPYQVKLPFLLQRLRDELNREMHQVQPIAGMKTALLKLKQQGYRLGIVTSNSHENVIAFLKAQDLDSIFDFVGSGLALFGKGRVIQRLLRRHHLNPEDVIYVGKLTPG